MISSYYFAQGVKDVAGFSNEDLQKWKGAGDDPFESEDKIEQMVAPAAFITKELDMYIDVRIKDAAENGTPQELQAWMQRKVERDMAGKDEVINKKFIAGFIAFLLGKTNPLSPEYKVIKETYCSPELWGKPEAQRPGDGWDLQKYPPIARHDAAGDEIRAYISTWTDKHFDTLKKAIALKINGPRTLREHFIFYKLIVMGGLKSYGTKPLPEIFTDGWDYPNGGGGKGPHPFDNDDDNGDERRDGYYRSMNNYGPEPPRDPTNITDRTALGNAYDPAESFAEILQNRWDRIRDRADRDFQERIANNELFNRRPIVVVPPPPPPPNPNPAPPPPQPQQPQQPAPPPQQAPPPPPPALPALAGAPAAALVPQPGLIQELPQDFENIVTADSQVYYEEIKKYAPSVRQVLHLERMSHINYVNIQEIRIQLQKLNEETTKQFTNINKELAGITRLKQEPANPVILAIEGRVEKTEEALKAQKESLDALLTFLRNEKTPYEDKEARAAIAKIKQEKIEFSAEQLATLTKKIQDSQAEIIAGVKTIINRALENKPTDYGKSFRVIENQLSDLKTVLNAIPDKFSNKVQARLNSSLVSVGNKLNELKGIAIRIENATAQQSVIKQQAGAALQNAFAQQNALLTQKVDQLQAQLSETVRFIIEYTTAQDDPMEWDSLPLPPPEHRVISKLSQMTYAETYSVYTSFFASDPTGAATTAYKYLGYNFNVHDPAPRSYDDTQFYKQLITEYKTADDRQKSIMMVLSSLLVHRFIHDFPEEHYTFQSAYSYIKEQISDTIPLQNQFNTLTAAFVNGSIQTMNYVPPIQEAEEVMEVDADTSGAVAGYITNLLENNDDTEIKEHRQKLLNRLTKIPDLTPERIPGEIDDLTTSSIDLTFKRFGEDMSRYNINLDSQNKMINEIANQVPNQTPYQVMQALRGYLQYPTIEDIQRYKNENSVPTRGKRGRPRKNNTTTTTVSKQH